ncbi:MAG: efflux RND transporter periplasmic adaptor subunit [Candidatus Thiodiazotropha sp.]|jgi:RND family efflux transporter MFP subunit
MTQTTLAPSLLQYAKRVLPLLVVILVTGITVAYLMNADKHAKRGKPTREARLVEAIEVTPTTVPLNIEAWGTVEAARQISLQAQVAGEIRQIGKNFEPGAYVEKGSLMLQIDKADYESALEQRRADLVKAKADLSLEEGKSAIAEQEFKLMGKEAVPSPAQRRLMLRQPQQATARATVSSAEAILAAAKLDLARTRVTAPFNALIMDRQSDLGARVSIGGNIATLVGTDTFWVELAVPAATLRWIDLPDKSTPGAQVNLYQDKVWDKGYFREGHVIRLRGDLDEKGRMARLLVEVTDPLALDDQTQQPLLIGSFVRAEIKGKELQNVLILERGWLRDDDKVWVMDSEDKLAIRLPHMVYRGVNQVFVRNGFKPGDRVVTSELAVAVEGMPLRLARGTTQP